ncbi:MAG: N-acetylglucosamine kinase [Rhizobiaceae bacterium]|nr:N-acetylglucosamine kinase [Rhizobiaceae bacterium]
MAYVLGIDGGGTSCRAALAAADGRIIGRGSSGSANIRTDLSGARASIVKAAELALADAGLDVDIFAQTAAVLGLAGANVGTYAQQVEAILPFRTSRVVTDALIALEGAVGAGDGAIAILGTGTAFMSRKGGEVRAIGGWGFIIGDQGSGARIGRDLLEETLLAHDGIVKATALTEAVLAIYRNDPRDVVEFTTSAKPGDFGGFAPMVFAHAAKGDETALRIVERARQAIEASLDALDPRPGAPLCLLGGMAPLFAPRLSSRFRSLLQPPQWDALGGAVAMAARLFGETGGEDVR